MSRSSDKPGDPADSPPADPEKGTGAAVPPEPPPARVSLARVRLRRWWRDSQHLVWLGAGFLIVVLGFWGLRTTEATESADLPDSLYRTIKLFEPTSVEIEPPISWPLQIARIAAPLLIGSAFLGGLYALFREQFRLLWVRLRFRRHVVIAGLGGDGSRLAGALADEGYKVVVIERSRDSAALTAIVKRGIPMAFGDATDPETLRDAGAHKASHIFALCGDDGTNLGVVSAAAELASSPGIKWVPAVVHAALENPPLWHSLRISALAGTLGRDVQVEFFSVDDLAGHALASEGFRGLGHHKGDELRVLIKGLGSVGQAATTQVVRRAIASEKRPVLMLLGEDDRDSLLAAQPGLEVVADVEVLDFDPLNTSGDPAPADLDNVDFALVALDDDAEGLAHGAALDATMRGSTPVVVAVAADGVERSLDAAGLRPPNMRALATRDLVLNQALLTDTALEAIARAMHDDYFARQLARGVPRGSKPSMQPWEDLPESFKEDNRAFADSVAKKVAEIGAVLAPIRGGNPSPAELELSPDLLEKLAEEEHKRWMATKIANNFRGPRINAEKADAEFHKDIVDWDELSEEDKDKDRAAVKGLPEFLAAAGLTILDRSAPQ